MPIVKKEERWGITEDDANAGIIQDIHSDLGEETEKRSGRERNILPNQTGFRRKMGTMDNIYTLNYLGRQLKSGKVLLFVDLKAAFDSVDRRVLVKMTRRKVIAERLIDRVEKVLMKTRSRVRVKGETGKCF